MQVCYLFDLVDYCWRNDRLPGGRPQRARHTGEKGEQQQIDRRCKAEPDNRGEYDGVQGDAGAKIAKKLKRTEGATRQKAFSMGPSLDTRA